LPVVGANYHSRVVVAEAWSECSRAFVRRGISLGAQLVALDFERFDPDALERTAPHGEDAGRRDSAEKMMDHEVPMATRDWIDFDPYLSYHDMNPI